MTWLKIVCNGAGASTLFVLPNFDPLIRPSGTVLSTNWSEVGAGKVEIRPPDGMEYKKYEI
ncbi:unnamed protein product [Schistosoma margrebowiei]|uniref:Uncharacterized protein n=1 Tax=Schistosoma margrebowiei TaxID=48269 RepID=A0A183N012_9TREM|nr:unnamed protein product [Schistosoma margrebowiei]